MTLTRAYRATTNPHVVEIGVPMSSDKTWQDLIMAEPLSIDRTVDEDGRERYFIATYLGDWVGEPFDTRELAASAITRMRRTYAPENDR